MLSCEQSELLGWLVLPVDYLATIIAELVKIADLKSGDAYQDITDDELLNELSGRLG